jgi:hypothetical protein
MHITMIEIGKTIKLDGLVSFEFPTLLINIEEC